MSSSDSVDSSVSAASAGVMNFTESASNVSQRQASVLSGLASRDQERQAAAQQRLLDRSKLGANQVANAGLAESLNAFLTTFDSNARTLQAQLEESLNRVSSLQSMPESDKDSFFAGLNSTYDSLHRCHAMDGVAILPPFDLARTSETLRKLKESIGQLKDLSKTKKRFTFGDRVRVRPWIDIEREQREKKEKNIIQNGNNIPIPAPVPNAAANAAAATSAVPVPLLNRFENLRDELIITPRHSLTGKDLFLSHLSHCTVFILDSPKVVHIQQLSHCQVYIGPCSGSILLYGAEQCQFYIAAHQIRLHDFKSCQFHCHVQNHGSPIVEHYEESHFGPYTLEYDGLQSDWVRSSLSNPIKDPLQWEKSFQIIDFLKPNAHLKSGNEKERKKYVLDEAEWCVIKAEQAIEMAKKKMQDKQE